ncbi:hypothetical protein AAZX31_20G007400 [Glycine max]|uniref:protein GL2-INTERACTING REPRESSOR 1 n=1 Tax=Glycine max TaxID=3847 RepID=UPI0003DE9CD4|nr:protein GL2-INTERACTING REPRESSOR 1 [Glycine max]XP_028220547.1 uncharacterized protein LOC114402243 [Glycine soja]KAH1033966.1 hypothetical protein GYH30_054393 [Glycine max]KRG89201.2 hypothetical protein GLYMA_20G008100v4 [Glycine max]|eukprot:XP_025983342.1 uncharacterized protein LOC102666286 [Glycine max]
MNSLIGRGVNFQVEAAQKGVKKRSLTESGMNEHENCVGLDLELKLSLAGSSSGNLSNALKSTTSRTLLPSSSSSHKVYLPSLLGINGNHEPTPLIATGCPHCLYYVMISEADPKCPNCKSYNLIDMFQENPTKKMRTC